jgi:predicted nuclease of predicted toxin-antitoxin system
VDEEIVARLIAAGHRLHRLREQLPTDASDGEVVTKAQQLGAILVSLNGDFADIVAYPPAHFVGIVALQLHNHPEIIPTLMDRLIAFLAANPSPEYYAGKLFLVEPHRIRIRA